jgi:hypothetical protein
MVCFRTKNPNLGKIFRVSDWKMLRILWPFGIFYWTFGILYDHLAHCVFIWYIFSGFGVMHQEKSGNSDVQVIFISLKIFDECTRNVKTWVMSKKTFKHLQRRERSLNAHWLQIKLGPAVKMQKSCRFPWSLSTFSWKNTSCEIRYESSFCQSYTAMLCLVLPRPKVSA